MLEPLDSHCKPYLLQGEDAVAQVERGVHTGREPHRRRRPQVLTGRVITQYSLVITFGNSSDDSLHSEL